jgi:hypothetical protein
VCRVTCLLLFDGVDFECYERCTYYVMQRLGHKNIKNTLLYVQLGEALFQGDQDYISKVAKTEREICKLVEAGFEYVTEFEGAKIFRKRKL